MSISLVKPHNYITVLGIRMGGFLELLGVDNGMMTKRDHYRLPYSPLEALLVVLLPVYYNSPFTGFTIDT